jgi:S-adenosylmethionine hydrolase
MIALLTDFGLDDPFVGEMKGVLLGLHPEAVIVDVTHGIRPGAVREAAWVLARSLSAFPDGTVHVAVVDPGVGTERRALAARCGGRCFVGPDNGVLMTALETLGGAAEIREITTRELDRRRRGTTFDGRDLFAPAAARLAAGFDLAQLGPEVQDPVPMPGFAPRPVEGGFQVEVVRVDRFGNVVLAAEEAFLRDTWEDWRGVSVQCGDVRLEGVRLGYGDVAKGESLLVIGGSGTLEIARNRGSADRTFGLSAGDLVFLAGPVQD